VKRLGNWNCQLYVSGVALSRLVDLLVPHRAKKTITNNIISYPHVQPKAGSPAICTTGTNTWTFYTFSEWQELGEDTAGSANTYPGFNDPVYPADDYPLPNGSPSAYFVVFDPTQPGRTNPVIKPTDPLDISPTFQTEFYNPATDY
jgi:hypothetical protein